MFLGIVCVLLSVGLVKAEDEEGILVMFWNLENFFDWMAGEEPAESRNLLHKAEPRLKGKAVEESADREFSSGGSRRWTRKRFYGKCDAVAKSIMWIGDRYGRMPDVIGVAEVENKGVLTRMLAATALRKFGYRVVHFESGDRRGIDVALMYRESSMVMVSASVKTPVYDGEKMATRDILHVRMRLADGREMDFIVNHHPSKYGGEKHSEGRRYAAMTALKQVCDSLSGNPVNGAGHEVNIIAMGDFNDTPDAESFDIIESTLVNKGTDFHERGEGTIRYEGKWDMIDMFMVSENLDRRTRMEICRVPFLLVRDRKHPGEKPLRTYSGPGYLGGVSDHLPIVLKLLRGVE